MRFAPPLDADKLGVRAGGLLAHPAASAVRAMVLSSVIGQRLLGPAGRQLDHPIVAVVGDEHVCGRVDRDPVRGVEPGPVSPDPKPQEPLPITHKDS